MSSVDNEYYEYLMSRDKSDLAIEIMNLDISSSNDRIAEFIKENDQLKQQLHDLPKKIVNDFYDEIRHRAILEDDYCQGRIGGTKMIKRKIVSTTKSMS